MLEVRLLGTFDIKYKKKTIGVSTRPAQSLLGTLIKSWAKGKEMSLEQAIAFTLEEK